MKPTSAPFHDEPWTGWVAKLGEGWGLPRLGSEVSINVSTRMRVSLGRCAPGMGVIRIASFLLDGPPALLEEVLAHELAHVATARLHGPGCRPHGVEWRALMREAGHDPRPTIPHAELDRLIPLDEGRRVSWVHRCPRCDARRLAGRPVKQWRCSRCQVFGFGGRLIVERIG